MEIWWKRTVSHSSQEIRRKNNAILCSVCWDVKDINFDMTYALKFD